MGMSTKKTLWYTKRRVKK